MSVNFAEALNQNVGDIERPKLPPMGTYQFTSMKQPDLREITSEKGSWDVCEFAMKALAPTDDVDQAELAEYGPITSIVIRFSFMFDKNDPVKFASTMFRLRTFLEQHLQCASEGDTLKQALANSMNAVCLGTVQYRPDKNDKEIMYAEIGATAPAS